jgi:hypothetical protein
VDGRPREAGELRVDDQDREPCVRRRVGIGATGEPDVVGVVRAAGEDLGAVHGVVVAVTHGARPQRREVGAGFRLGVPDREVDLAGEDAGQEAPLLLLAALLDEGGPHRVERHEGEGRAGPAGLLEPDLLLDRRASPPAVLAGPADTEPAVGAHLPNDPALKRAGLHRSQLCAHLGGDQPCVVLANLLPQRLLLGRVINVHLSPPRRTAT